jgi:type I restriction enzyme S subunit
MDLKYVDFPFKVKSSAIKILKSKQGINLKYVFEYLSFLNLKSSDHKRHYISEIEPMCIFIQKSDIQNLIANLFSRIDKKIESELSYHDLLLSQKQYLLNHLFT